MYTKEDVVKPTSLFRYSFYLSQALAATKNNKVFLGAHASYGSDSIQANIHSFVHIYTHQRCTVESSVDQSTLSLGPKVQLSVLGK